MKDNFKNEERLRHLADILPAGLEPYQAMKVLTEYVRSLEDVFEVFKKTMDSDKRQSESDYRALKKKKDDQKQEVDRLTSDLMDLTNTLEEQESILAASNQKISNYEKQSKKLHRENSELSNKMTQKENDAIFYRQELERSIKENDQLLAKLQTSDVKVDELERKLLSKHEIVVTHEKEARRLNLVVSEGRGKVALIEKKMEETILRYSDEIRRLTDRMNADAHHEVILLRKRVRSSVIQEMLELDQLMAARVGVESINHLKSLVGRLVTKLEQAGLDLI